MGNAASKGRDLMERRERTYTEHRRSGTLAMNLVREEFNRDIQDVYDLRSGELLGKGGFGTVRVVTHKETKQKFALKTIELKDVETHEQYEFLLNEIEIMKKLDHPNIARVQEVFHTPDHYYMVMDLYTGGDMYSRYKLRSEEDTAKIVGKLINALRYCHDRNVAHRDIKLENICFESMADDAEVKLVDFGLSVKEEQLRHDLVGSWPFMAPEVLQRAHHPKACDLWSMGVITYCLFAGYPPFRSVNLKVLKDQILHNEVQFDHSVWKGVSNNAKDFIRKLLTKDWTKRLTAQEAQQHPWLSDRTRRWSKNPKLSPQVVNNLLRFKNENLMKRVALGVVARTLEASEMRSLEQEFHKADSTQSGVISIEDFHEILRRSKQFKPAEIKDIFGLVDINCSGELSYTDFTAAALDRQNLDTRRLKYAFERLDHDNNGELDYEDLLMTVGSDLTTEQVRTAIKQFDTKGNGKVTFEDFCKGMRSTGGALDALSTAHLTSGYMVGRIEEGKGKAAIVEVATELERAPPPPPGGAAALLSTSSETQEAPAEDLPPLPQVTLHDAAVVAGSTVAGAEADAVPAAATVLTPAQQSGSPEQEENISAPRPPSPSSARAANINASTTGDVTTAEIRDSTSSTAATATLSRPQSVEVDGGAAIAAALVRSQAGGDAGAGAGRAADRPAMAASAAAAGPVSTGGDTSAGGGAEAAAPTLPFSEEIATAGGARAKPSPGDGTVGGAGLFASGGWGVTGEHTRGSLAERRMRDSLKILRGLGTPTGNVLTGILGMGAVGAAADRKSIGCGTGAVANTAAAAGAVAGTSSRFGTSPASALPSALLGLSAVAGKRSDVTKSLPRLSEGANGDMPSAAAAAKAAAAMDDWREALGAAAAAGDRGTPQYQPAPSQSGGRPAAGGLGGGNAELRNGSRIMLANDKMQRKKATVEDLPPRDSTAGSVDLGWGKDGPPSFDDSGAFDRGISSGSSQETAGSTTSRGSRTPKSQQSLRFKDVGVNGGKKSGRGKSKSRTKGASTGRQGKEKGGGLFGLGGRGARRSDGLGGNGDGRRQGARSQREGVYANYDGVGGGEGVGAAGEKRSRGLGMFCMPGDDSDHPIPMWLLWLGGVFNFFGRPEDEHDLPVSSNEGSLAPGVSDST